MSTEEPVEEQKKKIETQHNLQNRNKINWNGLRRKIMRHSIPTIIKRQISRDKIRKVPNSRTAFQRGDKKPNVNGWSGKTVSTTKSKLVVLGDSHLKRSVPRIGNYLSLNLRLVDSLNLMPALKKSFGSDNNGLIQTNKMMCFCAMLVLITSISITRKR